MTMYFDNFFTIAVKVRVTAKFGLEVSYSARFLDKLARLVRLGGLIRFPHDI